MEESKHVIQLDKTENPRKATAQVTEHTRPQSEIEVQQANRLLRQAAEKVKPFGSRYLGSAAVHYFEEVATDKPTFKTATQTLVQDVVEGLADFGWKRLKEALMQSYGKKPQAIRQDIIS